MLWSAGCGDDPVTTPGGEPLIYTGLLEQGERLEFPLILAEEGTIRIELTDATAVLVETGGSGGEVLPFTVGVGVGQDNQGTCGITFGSSLSEGENLTVLLEDTMRCLLIFDDGTLPLDAVIRYTVTVDDVEG